MRWLLLKDLQILRRSPLLVALLVAYPIVIALLIGFALSRGPDKPKVAFVNEVPPTRNTLPDRQPERSTRREYADRLFEAIDPVRVDTREEAIEKVRSGEALGALIVPEDVTEKLQGAIDLVGRGEPPTLEVIYNVEDPLKAQYVESTIKARLSRRQQGALATS